MAQSITLNGYSAEAPLELSIGKFPYADYSVSVTYDNGVTEELPLTEDMIPETDKLRFYQAGKSEITIEYKGVSTRVAIEVFRNEFSETVQLKDVNTTYTGRAFTVEVEGDIPGGTQILYPQGNTFQNAGVYDITAILQCDGYVTKTLSATVTIEKATYDMSGALLYSKTFVYDKDAHGISLQGKTVDNGDGTTSREPASLPQGVGVEYTITKVKDGAGNPITEQQVVSGNRAIDAGTYKVCARFKGDANNYYSIPDAEGFVVIQRADYDMSQVEFANGEFVYSGQKHSISIPSNAKLPVDVQVSYEIKKTQNGEGESVTGEYVAGNSATEAGVYLVKAVFSVTGKNAANYQTSPSEKEAQLTIRRASYEEYMADVYVNTQTYNYEKGGSYAVRFTYELPDGVTPTFLLKDKSGAVIIGELKTETASGNASDMVYSYVFTTRKAGEFVCLIRFEHSNENYEAIQTEIETWVFVIGDDSVDDDEPTGGDENGDEGDTNEGEDNTDEGNTNGDETTDKGENEEGIA